MGHTMLGKFQCVLSHVQADLQAAVLQLLSSIVHHSAAATHALALAGALPVLLAMLPCLPPTPPPEPLATSQAVQSQPGALHGADSSVPDQHQPAEQWMACLQLPPAATSAGLTQQGCPPLTSSQAQVAALRLAAHLLAVPGVGSALHAKLALTPSSATAGEHPLTRITGTLETVVHT
jgi:hypothetical protein